MIHINLFDLYNLRVLQLSYTRQIFVNNNNSVDVNHSRIC